MERQGEVRTKRRAERMAEAQRELRRFARDSNRPPPSEETVFELLERYSDAWDADESASTAAKDVFADYRDMVSPLPVAPEGEGDEKRGEGASRTAAGFAHYLASVMRPYAEAFRERVWGRPDIPFASPIEAAVWIEAQHEREGCGDEQKELKGRFRGVEGEYHTWQVCEGGTLDKLRRLGVRIAYRFEAWSEEDALAFVLWGEYPLLSPRWSVRKGGRLGPQTITITLPAPATEKEVLETYRAALKAQGIEKAPKGLTLNQEMLLRVGYSSARSWGERLSKWRAYRAHHRDALTDYTSKEHGRRAMSRDFERAEWRASWSGDARDDWQTFGLYALPLPTPAQEEEERAKRPPLEPFHVRRSPRRPAPWKKGVAPSEPRPTPPEKVRKPCPVDLERFTRLDALAPLRLSREEARGIVEHFSGTAFDGADYRKIAHLYDRIHAIAHDDVLRLEDR